jgi:hypothetical protein
VSGDGSLRDILQSIYDRAGRLTPALVVDEARDPGSPLHSRFDWDDQTAGEAWRRHQAHELIRSVRIGYRDRAGKQADVRAFHAIRADDTDQYRYEPAEQVAADPLLRQIVLRDMEREWRQLRSRYETFNEFWQMIREDAA